MTEKTLRDDLLKTSEELGLGIDDLLPNLTLLESRLTAGVIEDYRKERGDEWLKANLPVLRNQIEMMGEL